MLSLSVLFWITVGSFALIGAMRGWAREIVAMSGLVLGLFIVNQFGFVIVNAVGWNAQGMGSAEVAHRRQFFTFTAIFLTIVFFSYQGPRISSIGARLRPRDTFQDKLLGAIIGGINGYLVAGAIWAFLEFQSTGVAQWTQLPPGVPYPFDPSVLTRPVVGSTAANMIAYLPIPLLAPYLPYLMVIMFLFVIIVMI